MASRNCFSDSELIQLINSAAALDEQRVIEEHLESCARCRARLDETAGAIEVYTKEKDASGNSDALMKVMVDLRAIRPPPTTIVSPWTEFSFLSYPTSPEGLGRLGKYEVLRVVGKGGMGIVFAAFDPILNREVAIKVPAPALVSTAEAHARFMREARALASVKQDNIVTVFDVDEHEGTPYLVMELVEGQSLAERLEGEGSVPWNEGARIGAEISAALAVAHARGVVHRDIKPANILLEGGSGRTKVTDFGLAKSIFDVSLTEAGILAGTPEFMSPEQANDQDATTLSDLFSLGVVLHTIVVGESPFRGTTPLTTLRNLCNDEPKSLCDIDSAVPLWFSNIVAQLLSKRPVDRPQSATELIEVFSRNQSIVGDPAVRTSSPGQARTLPQSHHRTTLAVVAGLLIVGLLFAFYEWRETSSEGLLSDSKFMVAGHDQPFRSIEDAIAAAGDNGLVEVHGNGPYFVPSLRTGKSLAIQAAAGFQPVFVSEMSSSTADEPFLTATGDLRLEGIEIRWTVASRQGFGIEDFARPCLVKIDGGDLTMRNCRLVAGHMNCCLNVSHGSVDMQNCHLASKDGPCCVWSPGIASRWDAETCVFEGRVGVMFDAAGTRHSSVAEFEFRANTFASFRAFHMVMGKQLRRFEFKTERNALDVDELFALVPGQTFRSRRLSAAETRRLVATVLDWKESQNLYSFKVKYLSRGAGPSQEPLVESLEDWHSLWQQIEADSLEIEFGDRRQVEDDPGSARPFAAIRWQPTSEQQIGADLSRVGPALHAKD